MDANRLATDAQHHRKQVLCQTASCQLRTRQRKIKKSFLEAVANSKADSQRSQQRLAVHSPTACACYTFSS